MRIWTQIPKQRYCVSLRSESKLCNAGWQYSAELIKHQEAKQRSCKAKCSNATELHRTESISLSRAATWILSAGCSSGPGVPVECRIMLPPCTGCLGYTFRKTTLLQALVRLRMKPMSFIYIYQGLNKRQANGYFMSRTGSCHVQTFMGQNLHSRPVLMS